MKYLYILLREFAENISWSILWKWSIAMQKILASEQKKSGDEGGTRVGTGNLFNKEPRRCCPSVSRLSPPQQYFCWEYLLRRSAYFFRAQIFQGKAAIRKILPNLTSPLRNWKRRCFVSLLPLRHSTSFSLKSSFINNHRLFQIQIGLKVKPRRQYLAEIQNCVSEAGSLRRK